MPDESTDQRILTLMETLSQQAAERNAKLDQVATRLEMFGAQLVRQGERLDRVETQLNKLTEIVAGSDERSLVLRLSRLEQQMEVIRQSVANNTHDLETLLEWRNRAIAIGAAVIFLWMVATAVLNYVLP